MKRIMIVLFLLQTIYGYSQQITVTGIVSEETIQGIESLPGVTVSVVGTMKGTITDVEGRFTIEAKTDDKLMFSFIGKESQTIDITGRTVINIVMKDQLEDIDEVTVVGFGRQKKESVIGSISTISAKDLKVGSSNLTTAIAGRLAGVISYQRTGEPGRDNAEFFIRGATTFGYKKDPLILIDGMEYTSTELARLNPDDIESFSIMKDATSNAVYGARGANGVILVTTKGGGEGKAQISVRVENSFSSPTRKVELADPITYMKLHNESVLTRNPLGVTPYSQAQIENTESGINPIVFPVVDWSNELFKNYTQNQRANMSISGGGKVAKYYVAGAVNQDNGILKVDHKNNFNNNIDLKTYSLRSNVSINVSKTTQLGVRLQGTFDDYIGPIDGGEAIYQKVMRTSQVLFLPYYPVTEDTKFVNHTMFGNYDQGQYINPYADMVKGYRTYSRSIMVAQLELKQDLGYFLKGLTFNGMMNTNRRSYFDVTRSFSPFWYTPSYNKLTNTYKLNVINPDTGTDFIDFNPGSRTVSSTFHAQGQLNWKQKYNDKHEFTSMLIFLAHAEVSGNAGSLQESLPARNLGLSGRTTYGYDDRLFFEFNFGYNGSERFYKTERFGFFPSAGLAWSVSNEKFFEKFKTVFTKLRLRANYGLVGNDAIGSSADRFFYLSEVNMNNGSYGARFGDNGGYYRPGISIDRYDNAAITWETARNSTLGLEFGLFDKLEVIAEYFFERRSNILMDRASIPSTLGLQGSKPKANVGKSRSNSTELNVTYNDKIGNDFLIQVQGNFTYAKNKFEAYEEPAYDEPWLYRQGQPISQQWGYIAERLFVDDEEVRSSPTQNFGSTPTRGGDIKYRDINDDGVINTLDRVPIGFPTSPEIVYGFGFSCTYKGFDFSAFVQGSARSSFWIDPAKTAPFIDNDGSSSVISQNQLLQAYANDYWSEDNRDLYALWPRLSSTLNENNSQRSTWFMRDGSFMRLKQVEFGYTIPHNLLQRIRLANARLYVTGGNLLTLSKFKLWDVEMAGNGLGYPIQKTLTFGIQLGI